MHEAQLERARQAQLPLIDDELPALPVPSASCAPVIDFAVAPSLDDAEPTEQRGPGNDNDGVDDATSASDGESREGLSEEMLDVHSQRRALWEAEADAERQREERRIERIRALEAAEAATIAVSEAEVHFHLDAPPTPIPDSRTEAAGQPLATAADPDSAASVDGAVPTPRLSTDRPQSAVRPPPTAAASLVRISPSQSPPLTQLFPLHIRLRPGPGHP